MKVLRRLNLAEQAALHMQREIEEGRWKGRLPGLARLAADLGMSKVKVQEALALVEARGLIVTQSSGRHREVAPMKGNHGGGRSLRVGILLHEDLPHTSPTTQEMMLSLKHALEALGHGVFYTPKSQVALGSDLTRIKRMIEQHQADAWVVCRGSAQLFDWYRSQKAQFIAVDGASDDTFPSATSSLMLGEAMRESVQQLIALGHKRIVWVCDPHWVRPAPVKVVRDFQEQLMAAGLSAGDYNTPYYDGTPEGFQTLLHSLFRLTPPTAMIVPCQNHAVAVMGFLSQRGLSVPRHLSLVACSPGPAFHWLSPRISHFHFDPNSHVRSLVRWVEDCAKGASNQEREAVEVKFVAGETITFPSGL